MTDEKRISKSNVTANPLRLSQPSGAALAFMGVKGCVPLWHGVQGCTAFGKILFIQHFREPMPFQTTALTQVSVVMGGDNNLAEAVENVKKDARLIGVLTTGVAEASGVDIHGAARILREKEPDLKIVAVNTPDFEGSLETGWVKACNAMLKGLAKPRSAPRKRQAAVFVGPYITPGEVEWLRESFEAFGLRPILFPDIGDSLYGRLSDADYTLCAAGGVPVEEIATLADSAFVVSVGQSMETPGADFAATSGISCAHFDHLGTLEEIDRLFMLLAEKSGQPVPRKFRRERQHLLDTLLDTQFHFHGVKAGVAGDPEFVFRWHEPLRAMGISVTGLSSIPCEKYPTGDLSRFAELTADADLLVGNSHVADLADENETAAVRSGIPVYDRFGEPQAVRTGYAGLAALYRECANALMERPPEKARPYLSPLQKSLE